MSQATEVLTKTILKLSRPAVERLLQEGESANEFFNEEEEQELAKALAGVYGTANLFGHARIRLRADQAIKNHGVRKFSDESTSFALFGDDPLPPLQPLQAIKYFLKLVPSLSLDPERWGAALERHSFTLAVGTSERMLDRVQQIIAQGIAGGRKIGYGGDGSSADINAILNEAGVTPKNPQYAEMVGRTNTMDALTAGSQAEQYRVRDTFPAWKYASITKDMRGRKWHRARNGMIFPVEIPFVKVRGEEIEDAANCRCLPIPVDKWELEEYLKRGGVLAHTWPVKEDFQ